MQLGNPYIVFETALVVPKISGNFWGFSPNVTYLSMGLLNSLGKSAEKVTISRAPEVRDY